MTEKMQLVADAVVASTATKFTYTCLSFSAISSFFEGVNVIPWLSLVLAFLTFVVNFYYKMKENKRAEEKHREKK